MVALFAVRECVPRGRGGQGRRRSPQTELTVGRSANDQLRDIDHAFDAGKINATRSIRRLVIVVVIPRRQRDGMNTGP